MMPTPEREEALFQAAAQLPSSQRAAFLDQECQGQCALRERLEALLAAHELRDSFMTDIQEFPSAPDRTAEAPDEAIGMTIGRYKLLERIGEGGCGVVYVAEQTEPIRRRVALKLIKLGMDTKQVVARFEAERQAVAMMDHPNIAKVLDAGTTETGRPYFVMELVRGIRITDYCDQHQVNTRERLDLFIQVCQAIQHAHQKGIIHRDIKPSNILVTLHDGVPVPKVIDFGIAKATEGRLTESTVYTQLHQFIGTPAYMSPEQAEMSGLDIDTRSDIYSLGVLLYELLTARTPFDANELIASGIDAMRKTIREKGPLRPSTRLATLQGEELTTTAQCRGVEAPRLVHLVKGDLDWIVMKCLEKDRTRRYETANGLAMDIKRHLGNEPIVARPPSASYRFQKAWRRNKLAYTAGLLIVAALVLGITVSVWQAAVATQERKKAVRAEAGKEQEAQIARQERQKADAARERAERNERQARRSLYTAAIYAAQGLMDEGNFGAAQKLLAAQVPGSDQDDLRGWEWRYLSGRLRGDYLRKIGQHEATVTALAVSPDGKSLLGGDLNGCAILWDLAAKPPVQRHRLSSLGASIQRVGFSASGRVLATIDSMGRLKSWRLDATRNPSPLSEEVAADFAFLSTSERVGVLGTNGVVEIRDLFNGQSRRLESPAADNPRVFRPAIMSGRRVAISADESRVAATEKGRGIRVWNLSGGSPITFIEPDEKKFDKGFLGLHFLSDNKSLVTSSFTYGPEFWGLETNHIRHLDMVGDRNFGCAAVAPGSDLVVFGGWDHTLRVWTDRNRRERVRLHGHRSEVWCVALSPDGTIFSGGQDREILQWSTAGPPTSVALKLDSTTHLVTFSPDNQLLAIGQSSGRPLLVHLSSRSRRELQIPGHPIAFSPDGQLLHLAELSRSDAGPGLERWSTTGRLISANIQQDDATAEVRGTSIRDAQYVAGFSSQLVAFAAVDPPRLIVKEVVSAEQVAEVPLTGRMTVSAEFAPDGSTLVVSTPDADGHREASVWTLKPLRKTARLPGHARSASQTAFSPNGRLLATGSLDGTIRLWRSDLWTLEQNGVLTGHKRGVADVTFSRDGKTLASCNDDGTVKLWDVETKGLLMSLPVGRFPTCVEFSPNGRTLVVLNGLFYSEVDELLIFTAPSAQEIDAAAMAAGWTDGHP